jgi:hypothetical protein
MDGVWTVEALFIMPAMPAPTFALKRTMTIVRMPDQMIVIFNPARLNPVNQDEVREASSRHLL